jgi:hypothetical protein
MMGKRSDPFSRRVDCVVRNGGVPIYRRGRASDAVREAAHYYPDVDLVTISQLFPGYECTMQVYLKPDELLDIVRGLIAAGWARKET